METTIKLTLKNQKQVTIRPASIEDAENLLNCIERYVPESKYIPKLSQELKLSIEEEKEWIHSFIVSKNSILLVAECEGRIIGNIDLTGSKRQVMEHTAVIGMGMEKEWRNAGLGTAFLSTIIAWAKNNTILELIWLQVYTENEAALNLYKKMGFEIKGVIEKFFKHDDQYFDNLTMSMIVK